MQLEKIKENMANLLEDDLLKEIKDCLESEDCDANEMLSALQDGMTEVGNLFEEGEYFVGDLIYAGEIMNSASELLKSTLSGDKSDKVIGKMIICTVQKDLHDIGKNIVRSMLEANGFDVLDLGIDVPPEKIVEAAKSEDIGIIALSGVLTLSLDSMKDTVDAFISSGMRDKVKIIVGGAPVNEESFKRTGADAWATSPQRTVEICKSWTA